MNDDQEFEDCTYCGCSVRHPCTDVAEAEHCDNSDREGGHDDPTEGEGYCANH